MKRGSETWTLTENKEKHMEAADLRSIISVLRMSQTEEQIINVNGSISY
jgi:hypothetical protein